VNNRLFGILLMLTGAIGVGVGIYAIVDTIRTYRELERYDMSVENPSDQGCRWVPGYPTPRRIC
jgi:hypothetical protein